MNMPSSLNTAKSFVTSHKKMIFPAIVVAIILLVIIFSGKSSDTEKRSKKNKNTAEVAMLATQEMTPVANGSYTYTFKDIKWDYVTSNDAGASVLETSVGFFFDGFTRRDGASPVVFKRPFYIGLFQGDCTTQESVIINENLATLGNPIAFSICGKDKDQVTIGLFQNNAMMDIYTWTADTEPVLKRDIDITNVVSSGGSAQVEPPVDFSDPLDDVINRRRTIQQTSGI
jgi:hypothetical protein